jgi:hypothetical protein
MEHARRLLGPHHDVLAVHAVADLRRRLRGRQLRRCSDGDDLAPAENGDAVGELLGLVEVVRREEDRLAERPQRANRLPRRAPRGGVEARRRLVEEDQLGIADERDGEVQPPLLPA